MYPAARSIQGHSSKALCATFAGVAALKGGREPNILRTTFAGVTARQSVLRERQAPLVEPVEQINHTRHVQGQLQRRHKISVAASWSDFFVNKSYHPAAFARLLSTTVRQEEGGNAGRLPLEANTSRTSHTGLKGHSAKAICPSFPKRSLHNGQRPPHTVAGAARTAVAIVAGPCAPPGFALQTFCDLVSNVCSQAFHVCATLRCTPMQLWRSLDSYSQSAPLSLA
jgi:hypothetical protein